MTSWSTSRAVGWLRWFD